eukprot:scaffold88971_cov81-Phaeocystis_antarctica.AAC.1
MARRRPRHPSRPHSLTPRCSVARRAPHSRRALRSLEVRDPAVGSHAAHQSLGAPLSLEMVHLVARYLDAHHSLRPYLALVVRHLAVGVIKAHEPPRAALALKVQHPASRQLGTQKRAPDCAKQLRRRRARLRCAPWRRAQSQP